MKIGNLTVLSASYEVCNTLWELALLVVGGILILAISILVIDMTLNKRGL